MRWRRSREAVERVGPAHLRARLLAMVEPARQLAREQARALVVGDVGRRPMRRDAVEVHEGAHAVGRRLDQVRPDRAALAVADQDQGIGPNRVEHGEHVAHVGVPAVELGVLGVAVAALVPRHHAKAGVREQRREHVEGAGEVEAAVGEQDRGRVGVAPLGDRRGAGPATTRSAGGRDGARRGTGRQPPPRAERRGHVSSSGARTI